MPGWYGQFFLISTPRSVRVFSYHATSSEIFSLSGGTPNEICCDRILTSIDTSNVTIPVYSIGDADRPGRIINALFQAYCTAREF